ncbi:BRO1-like domain-containing protein [Ditylenchus destructor]|nr:BRO1-like domain-containing protein [Ditylenchus destructor]
MTNFISVPLKTTSEVDYIKPLKSYVDTLLDLKSELKIEVNEGIVELNKLRSRACIQPLDRHQTSLDIVTRYYDQLCSIECKLPITPTQNPISFKWRDAFAKSSYFFSKPSLTISDSSFERAAVLFNCGALMSMIAATQQTHTDEELKTMAKLFQQSAGVFSKLKDSVLGLVQQEPTSDLLPDTLSALSSLMLAQAQEAIYIKAATNQMKSVALVKIASQCAEFYQDAQKLMSRELVKGIWDKDWLRIVTGKSLAYSAIAQHHQAQVVGEAKEIGEQISRLKEAARLMEQTNNYLPLTSNFSSDNAAIKKALEQAVKDNDFIYHERIPEFRTLAALPKAPLAKALPVTMPMSPRFKDLFESLVPVAVQNALMFFESRKSDVVNLETSRLREYSQIMNACLASLNLPAALDDVKNKELLPENEEILNEIARLLKDEKENDDNLRNQFRDKWSRVPSDKLTTPLQQELGKYRGILNTASSADNVVRNKFDANRRGIELLSQTENELKSSIPGLKNDSAQQNSTAVPKLMELMDQVQEIKVEREKLEKSMKEVRFDMCNDFQQSMSDNGIVNEEKLSSEKIEHLFGPLKKQVEESLKKQEMVLNDVQKWNNKFAEEKHGSGSVERENFLKLLATAYDAFLQLEENLNEGTKFYNDLTPILVRLQQKVTDFCFARQTEKEDLMKQVQQNILSGKNDPQNQPPVPPQHQQWNYVQAPTPQMPSFLYQQQPQTWNQAPAPQVPSYPYQPQMQSWNNQPAPGQQMPPGQQLPGQQMPPYPQQWNQQVPYPTNPYQGPPQPYGTPQYPYGQNQK